ncbi:MAG: anthranilate synthase component I [Acidimicrobiia bacterium]|nr:anthranilate synthase component I [Acidimicrobiia bacterium]
MAQRIIPDLETFTRHAERYGVVPITVTVVADRETPVTIYEKLVGAETGFLLESAEGGEEWGRWSFLGWDPHFTLLSRDGRSWIEGADIEVPPGDALEVLEALVERYSAPDWPGLPPLHSGAVGALAYDAVRLVEHLPNQPPDDRGLPTSLWMFVGALAAFDRRTQSVTLIRNVFVEDGDPKAQYDDAVIKLERDIERLGGSQAYTVHQPVEATMPDISGLEASMSKDAYMDAVRIAKSHILAGDVFQVVPSLRLEMPFTAEPFAVYRHQRLLNPSPFLYFVHHEAMSIVGASPEIMSRVRDGIVYSRPIAGTRPRGASSDEDQRLEAELLADPKERAEHVMLVDLARNDLGRVCEYGSVEVDDLMVVERYSHVMHIVSGVSGKLTPGKSAVEVLRATFPHGTVSGAPKVRAMEIIDDIEPVARGPYAGAVGYIDFTGSMDTAIALRTVVIGDNKAWVQAGAGIVADSDPALEYQECLNKAAAALSAVRAASE